ncbi:MAG TPA: hypothetical protein PKU98_11825 [Saprospiraceae bacterium]|nr:hypothetical protein [Saprospiraceae bacterium]HMX85062.1 hypothetical protein [Saprospiraceae bacterium]HNG07184.1 hypothetical protein [Saprospiraceae bacterium]HNL94027.1 hypothetical protein [Saprospiraceae bacterium]HNM58242.1 hypothetical protein [Saprospiraceae bacterium]
MKRIHVVSFDVPYPPNYGGVFAVYQLLQFLKECNVNVVLHVFTYNKRQISPELNVLCEKIITYKRNTGLWSQLSILPYIVRSRRHPDLRRNLIADDEPVLFEGVHTCYWLKDVAKVKANVFVRAHNIEADYYRFLAKYESELTKRIFFSIEAYRLRFFEKKILKLALKVFCFTQKDAEMLSHYGVRTVVSNPFFSSMRIQVNKGNGRGILIHGNLAINDTVQSIRLILQHFKDYPEIKMIIAGRNPADELINYLVGFPQVQLIINPDDAQLPELIQDAHIHLCHTNIEAGFKMRLMSLLQYGKFIVCNEKFCTEPLLKQALYIENDLAKWPALVKTLLGKDFEPIDIEHRSNVVNTLNGTRGIGILIEEIFGKNTKCENK